MPLSPSSLTQFKGRELKRTCLTVPATKGWCGYRGVSSIMAGKACKGAEADRGRERSRRRSKVEEIFPKWTEIERESEREKKRR